RDIRNGAAGKFEAGVSNIHFVAEDRDTDGFNFDHRFADKSKQDVEVMDHEVINHVYIEAPRAENTESMHFEKKWAIQDRFHREHGRIDTLDVADLQNAPMLFRGREKSIGVGQIFRHRLFDEHIQTKFHQAAANLSVGDSRYGNARGIHLAP